MPFDNLLIHTLTLKANSPAQHAQGEPVDNWSGSTTIKARIQPVGGGEEFTGGRRTVRATHKIFSRAATAITARNRLVYGSRTFDVLNVRNIDEAGRHYEIDCLEVV